MTLINRIAYLAPEIPGLSSTFVYNEIFALTDDGFTIETFSVHRTGSFESDEKLKHMASNTTYLYEQGWLNIIVANAKCLLTAPLVYGKTMFMCFSDMLKMASQPKVALGLFYRFLIGGVLAGFLKKKQLSHLHIHFAHIPTDIGMYAAALAGISYSTTAHANDIFERAWLLKEKVERAKFLATISNFNVNWLIKLGADKSKLQVVRCGVDSRQFNMRAEKQKKLPVLFGFLGRLVEKKGADVLLEACAHLRQQWTDFLVQIVGDGPLEQALKEKVSQLNLQDNIHFLGAKPHAEVAEWLGSLDYFVLPCVKDSQGDMDGIPVALMEAMLKGIPVISTDISGIPELVIGGETGLSAPYSSIESSNIESLAAILFSAISEPLADVRQRVEKAHDLVCSEYDLTINAKKLSKLIRTC